MRHPLTGDYTREGNIATFTFDPETEDGAPIVVTVAIEGEELDFYPDRSSGHKRVMASLGITVP